MLFRQTAFDFKQLEIEINLLWQVLKKKKGTPKRYEVSISAIVPHIVLTIFNCRYLLEGGIYMI